MSTLDNVVSLDNILSEAASSGKKSFEDIKEDNIKRRLLLRKLQPEIKQRINLHMAKVMQGMFDTADDALFKMAESSDDGVDKNLYFDSMRVIRLQRKSMEETFFNELENYVLCFEHDLDNEKKEINWVDVSVDSMELISESDLEINLATDNLIQKIRSLYAFDLSALDKRMAYLINNKHIETPTTPFSAEVLVKSFVKAAEVVQLTLEIQLIVMKLFDLHCIHNLSDLYSSINTLFISENVLPVIKQEIIKTKQASSSLQNNNQCESANLSDVANIMGSSVSIMPMSSDQLSTPMWTQLQQLINLQRRTGDLANDQNSWQPNITNPNQVSLESAHDLRSTPEVVSALTDIQSMSFDEVPEGGAYAVGNFLRVQLRQANDGEHGKLLNPIDNDLIDIVSLIFEYILDDPYLPMTAKASIARLQIPMLKVAMLDKDLFSMNGHPARYLLNLLASTAVGIDDSGGLDHPILNKINEIVETILANFTDDMHLFSEITVQLNEFISEHQDNEQRACKDLSQIQHEKEELALAKAWVKETLSQHLIGRELPKPVVDIILGPWKDVMLETYLQQGELSQLWKTQIRFIDVLCWSVEPNKHNLDRKKLGVIIQQLVATLRDGFELIEMPEQELDIIFSTLEPYHMASVGLGLSDCLVEDDSERLKTIFVDGTNQDSINEDSKHDHEEKVVLEEIVLEDWGPAKDLDQVEDEYLELARHLEMGKWVEFTNENGTTRRAKLAWKSDLLGEFTFLNWKFDVVADKSLHELANDLRHGHARVVNDVPLMDRALSAVVSGMIPKAR